MRRMTVVDASLFFGRNDVWQAMCAANMDLPKALTPSRVHTPFVYDRRWGLFTVPGGYHQQAMALLWAWHQGKHRIADVIGVAGLKSTWEMADAWLEHAPCGAFRSSVGKTIQIACAQRLNSLERRILMPWTEVFPGVVVGSSSPS